MHFKFATGCSLLLAALTCDKPPVAWAHAYPSLVSPADGSTVTQPPREIRIQFTEGVELEFSRVDIKSSNGEKVSQGKLRKVAEDTLAVDVKPLPAGNYSIEWQVLSVDTHITEGVLRFTVKTAGK
jgi:methionine-rich copper-binding protein CopC